MRQEIIRIDLEGVNCYLIKIEDGFILIDTGGHLVMDKTFTDRGDRLERALEANGCIPGSLKLIVLTHGDSDHAENAAKLREKYHTQIAMHAGDLELVHNPTIEKAMTSFNYDSFALKLIFKLMKSKIRNITQKTLDDFTSFSPDIFIDEGCFLQDYGFNARIIHIPGHTSGSIGILTANGEFISGDIFANMKKPGPAPNASDFKLLDASIKRIKEMNINMIYPGHGEPFEIKDLK